MGDIDNSRRDFVKKAALLSSAAGLFSVLPMSIQQALAIDAAPGSTFMDAEHVVFLMQENRSFDHCFGSLKGVRGFNDPRAIRLSDDRQVWLQRNAAGQTYAPFRLNLKETKSTWMSSLPHSWENQVDALNGGKNDNWLESKKSGHKEFADMPLTMGYYNRQDIPFYYALADAFTVCDQHFCSALTGTSPNRLYFWTGTIRAEQDIKSKAHVYNGEIDHKDIHWPTFPERLEDAGVSWKVYQNELSIPVGLEGEAEDWLSNFTDNDLEFFSQYNVRLHPEHLAFMERYVTQLEQEISLLKQKSNPATTNTQELVKKEELLKKLKKDQEVWNKDKFAQLSEKDRNIHQKAFVTNAGDPDYHQLVSMTYDDEGQQREMKVPKGDVLHQFRKDVQNGELPEVSWLVPPSNFSDHPGSPWYGAWYVSEVMDILTRDPEQWKKTIFIITYDENDGYFDHVPPFLPPHPDKPETGKASAGLDTRAEHVSMEEEIARGMEEKYRRESPIGLGFRVPMLVVSPWTKGGWVNSQVFDHTSCLQFLEEFLSKKTGKVVAQPQISDWRRTVCGNLTSVFRVADDQAANAPAPLNKDRFIQLINNAKFKPLPSGFNEELPQQEKGVKRSNAIPYQLYVTGKYHADRKSVGLTMESRATIFGDKTAGSPFTVYLPGKTKVNTTGKWDSCRSLSYAVKAGDKLNDDLLLSNFEDEFYHIQVNGPNGFFREFKGNAQDPDLRFVCEYQHNPANKHQLTGNIEFIMVNLQKNSPHELVITDHAYGAAVKHIQLIQLKSTIIDLKKSYGWYDFSVQIAGNNTFEQRFAGRVETGKPGYSDPAMGA